MGTIALFITVFILLCIFALIFVCYRAGHDSRQEEVDEETGVMQRATYVLSTVRGSAASSGMAVQSYSSQRARVSLRKSPTPPTIIRNLPCMVWDRPKAAAGSKGTAEAASSEESDCMCVICCCEYEAGEQIKLLPCLHMYHQLCIDAWLERSHVCPVCQADVIRAAGLSAATGDWSVHTQLAVNQISGVQQQQQQQAGGQVVTPCDGSTPQQDQHQQHSAEVLPQQQQQQQQQHVTGPATPEPDAPQPSVSSPIPADRLAAVGPITASPAAGGTPTATAASAGDAYSQRVSSGSSGHSSDAIALVVAAAPAAAAASSNCSGGSIAATPNAAAAVTPLTRV